MHSIFLIHYLINTYGKILVLLRKTGGKKIITSSGIIDGKTYNRRKNKCISYVQIKFLAFVRSSLEVSVVWDCSINFCKKCLKLF